MRIFSALLVCLCVGCFALAEADESKITCKGNVVDADGKPVAGAEVRSYQMASPFVREIIIQDKTKTDSNGEFTLTWNLADQPYNYGMVVAKKDGMSLGWDNWNRQGSDKKNKPIEMTIILGKCAAIEGVTADKEGKPITDAKVHLMLQQMQDNRHTWLMGYPSIDWITQTTSADGKFKFDDIPENATIAFIVTAPGMAKAVELGPGEGIHQPTFKPGEKDIKITMAPEAKMIGKLASASDNKPVAGIKLLARLTTGISGMSTAVAESQADGSFEFTELLAGDYEIRLLPTRGKMQDWVTKPVTAKAVEGKPEKDVCIQLSKGGILEVTVTDEKTKKPVVGAGVYVQPTQGMTDKNGIARLRLLPGVHTMSNVYCQGYLQQNQSKKVEIIEGETEKVNFTLKPMPKLCGIVVDPNGKPVADAALSLVGGWTQPVKTSEDGKFEIVANYHTFGEGQEPQVFIIARQEKLNMAGMVETDRDKPEGIEIKLQPAVTIECKVTDEEGKPIENARSYIMIRLANMGTSICQTKSDAKGNMKFDAIPAGERCRLTVEGEKHGKAEQEIETDEGDTQPLKYDIKLPDAVLTISGVVVDTDEKPVVGADVHVYGRSQSSRNVKTDKYGKFIIKNVVDDTIQMHANSQINGRYQYGSINAKGGDKDVVLVLGQQAGQPREDSREKTPSLKGKPLKSLETFGLEPAEKLAPGKKLLVCFWNMKQRPSRHMVTTLAKQAEELRNKGIVVLVVQTSQYDPEKIAAWIKKHNITFATGCVKSKDQRAERLLKKWGVQNLPWLVLTDDKHIVQAEGITAESLVD